jgi:hypothetical protein
MRRAHIIFRVCLFLIAAACLNYVLPQHDIVQITQVETKRTDFGGFNKLFYAQADSGSADIGNRDIFYIYGDRKKTYLMGLLRRDAMGVIVYRNEDTGWIWPPYFKFDSSNLQAEAASLARRDASSEGGNWSVVTHYGWRIPFLSIFPNAVNVKPADGPDMRIIPWFNVFFFIFLMIAIVFLRAMWMQFRERSVDPLLNSAGHHMDEVQAGVAERKGRVGRWLETWRSKK